MKRRLKSNPKAKEILIVLSIYGLIVLGIFGISARAKWFNENQKKTDSLGTQISQNN